MTPEELAHLSQAVRDARQAVAAAEAARDAAIVQAAVERLPKHTVWEATGLTKEQVRRIERAGNAPKRAAGRPPGNTIRDMPTDTENELLRPRRSRAPLPSWSGASSSLRRTRRKRPA